jgi:hypothetical protein
VTLRAPMSDYDVIVPPPAPPPPRRRVSVEWRAPWLQDPRHLRPADREPPLPEFDDEIEVYLYYRRMAPHNLHGPGH